MAIGIGSSWKDECTCSEEHDYISFDERMKYLSDKSKQLVNKVTLAEIKVPGTYDLIISIIDKEILGK